MSGFAFPNELEPAALIGLTNFVRGSASKAETEPKRSATPPSRRLTARAFVVLVARLVFFYINWLSLVIEPQCSIKRSQILTMRRYRRVRNGIDRRPSTIAETWNARTALRACGRQNPEAGGVLKLVGGRRRHEVSAMQLWHVKSARLDKGTIEILLSSRIDTLM
jgi:hypothetical protein